MKIKGNTFKLLIFILILAIAAALSLPVNQMSLLLFEMDSQYSEAFLSLRVTRVLSAATIGMIVGYCGYLTQLMFRNPLATPSILGVTATGTAFSTLMILLSSEVPNINLLIGSSMVGVTVISFFWVILQRKINPSIGRLLLIGFGVNVLMAAVTGFILALSRQDPNKSRMMLSWIFGGLSYIEFSQMWLLLLVGILLTLFLVMKKRSLGLLNLGEDIAFTYGVHVNNLKIVMLAIVSISIGIVCAVCGNIPFLGIIAPYLATLLFNAKHSLHVFHAGFIGAIFFVIADLLSRNVFYPTEIETGIFSGLLSAPIFIYILIKDGERFGT